MSTRQLVMCVAIVAVVACSKKKSEPAQETAAPPPDTTEQVASTSPAAPTDWVVVAHRIPGVSAMSEADAATWHGRVVRMAPEMAISGTDTCASPVYATVDANADSLLGLEYRVRAADLGLLTDRVRVTRVTCGGALWSAMGAIIVWRGDDRGLAPWDGVFFELQSASVGP